MKKVFFCILVILLNSCGTSDKSADSSNDLDSRSFQFTYDAQLEPSNQKVEVWIPIPQTNEVQTISNLSLVNDDLDCTEYAESTHGNRYYYCVSDNGISELKTLSLTCDVVRKEHQAVSYKNLDPTLYDKGTNSQYVIEGFMFDNIIKKNNLVASNMRGIYDYVLNGMHYGKPKDNSDSDQYFAGDNPKTGEKWLPEDITYGEHQVSLKQVVDYYKDSKTKNNNYTFGNGNSQYACDVGVGNCTDYHSYFMSLCRSINIPARFHMGFSVPNKASEGKIGGYHCWADYFIDGDGWYPVDISNADKDPAKIDYFFGTVCSDRVEFTTGRDLNLENYGEEVNFFIYPLVKGTKLAAKNFSYKNL